MGHRGHLPSSHAQLGRNDGRQVLPRRQRSRLRHGLGAVPVILLSQKRDRTALRCVCLGRRDLGGDCRIDCLRPRERTHRHCIVAAALPDRRYPDAHHGACGVLCTAQQHPDGELPDGAREGDRRGTPLPTSAARSDPIRSDGQGDDDVDKPPPRAGQLETSRGCIYRPAVVHHSGAVSSSSTLDTRAFPCTYPLSIAEMATEASVHRACRRPPTCWRSSSRSRRVLAHGSVPVRGPVCTVLLIVGAIGYLMLACLKSTAARYVGIWLIINGLFPFIPILYMWLMANQMSESKKGLGLVIFATIGQCGPLLGTHLFPSKDQPYYVKGTATSAGLLLFGVVCRRLPAFGSGTSTAAETDSMRSRRSSRTRLAKKRRVAWTAIRRSPRRTDARSTCSFAAKTALISATPSRLIPTGHSAPSLCKRRFYFCMCTRDRWYTASIGWCPDCVIGLLQQTVLHSGLAMAPHWRPVTSRSMVRMKTPMPSAWMGMEMSTPS